MNSEELYKALTNEDLIASDMWDNEIKGTFVCCVFSGFCVEVREVYGEKWYPVTDKGFYKAPSVYMIPGSNNIFRVLF